MEGDLKKVSLVKGGNRYDNIIKALGLIRPDLEGVRNKKNILIKPNLTATQNELANTDVKDVEAVIDFLLDNFSELSGSRFTILEGSGSAYYEKTATRDVFRKFGYYELIKKYRNVKLECIEDFSDFTELHVRSIAGGEKIRVIKHFYDFDHRISIAVPKTHNYAIATFGIKNMAGMIKQEDKSILHGLRTPSAPDSRTIFTYIPTSYIAWMRRRASGLVNLIFKKSITYLKATKVIHRNVAELARHTRPDLVVLDGFRCMDGNGPVDGFPVDLNAAVCSTDPLKADGIGARLMGLQPEEIGYLYYLGQEGFGDYSLAGLVGDSIESARLKFKMHPTYNIQKDWKNIISL
ncbi:MAG: DUF362 domain-containing protein [Candidatus Omnitrophica bacterium]|nr:DUF362 domain-containing protein [Candidatus Omnitrophota bacterium]